MSRVRFSVGGALLVVLAVATLTCVASADSRTYTVNENGQQYTVKETWSSDKDAQGRTYGYHNTEEWRDKSGKLVKVVRLDKSYHFDKNGKWSVVNETTKTTVYNADGGNTTNIVSTNDNREDFTGTSETNTYQYDANGKLVGGTEYGESHGVGKEKKESHSTYNPKSGKWEYDVWDPYSHKWISKEVPTTTTPAPPKSAAPQKSAEPSPAPKKVESGAAPLDENKDLTQVTPDANAQGALAQGMLPPIAGAGSEIVLDISGSPQTPEGGAGGVLLITEDQQGHKKYLSGKGNAGRLVFLAALAEGTLKAIDLVTKWDEHGDPVATSHCDIGDLPHLPGTQSLADVTTRGLSITEAASSAQPGDTMLLHLRGNDPVATRFLLDGRPVHALGISDESAVLQFDRTTSLAHHALVMQSGNESTRPLTVAFVQLTPRPIPVAHPGTVETVTIDVAGLAPDDRAVMYFELVGDAATIVGGGTTAAVTVSGGEAQVRIVGRHSGGIGLRYHLVVKNPQFVDTSTRLPDLSYTR